MLEAAAVASASVLKKGEKELSDGDELRLSEEWWKDFVRLCQTAPSAILLVARWEEGKGKSVEETKCEKYWGLRDLRWRWDGIETKKTEGVAHFDCVVVVWVEFERLKGFLSFRYWCFVWNEVDD